MRTQDAKKIPLSQLLEKLGCQPSHHKGLQTWYFSPFREETEASFHIHEQKNIWYDFGLGQGGDIIDFVQVYYGHATISKALKELDRLWGSSTPLFDSLDRVPSSIVKQQQVSATNTLSPTQSSRIETVMVKDLHHYALKDYLRQRGIDPALARHYVKELHYRLSSKQTTPYFALAFPNRTADGNSGYELRSKHFQGVHGRKDISLWMPPSSSPDSHEPSWQLVSVFEGFMDFLSLLTLKQMRLSTSPVLILNGVTMVESAIEVLRTLPVAQVQCFLDRDNAGQEAMLQLKDGLSEKSVTDMSGFYEGHKDINDYLMARMRDTPLKRA